MHHHKPDVPSFDKQAIWYNKRAGFSTALCASIATAVKAMVPEGDESRVLDIGCGTGQIGHAIDAIADDYLGLDASVGMLEQFKTNHPSINGAVQQSDARRAWPVSDGSYSVVFSSRALHWLSVEHAISESYRVTPPGQGVLVVGRIERGHNSWEALLRERLHALMRESGLEPRDGKQHLTHLQSALKQSGATALEAVIVGTWQSTHTVEKVIANWASKEGLAGTLVRQDLKDEILTTLKQWANDTIFSNADNVTDSQRRYALYGFKLID